MRSNGKKCYFYSESYVMKGIEPFCSYYNSYATKCRFCKHFLPKKRAIYYVREYAKNLKVEAKKIYYVQDERLEDFEKKFLKKCLDDEISDSKVLLNELSRYKEIDILGLNDLFCKLSRLGYIRENGKFFEFTEEMEDE